MKKGVTLLETVYETNPKREEKFWSDEEILDLFPDDDESLVNKLLRRAQQNEFVCDVIKLLASYDLVDSLFWDVDKQNKITVAVNCNDLFYWATADAEDITPETLPELKKTIEDLNEIDEYAHIWVGSLFAARRRKMRPQGAAYPHDKRLWELFDACGPEREKDKSGFGNPYTPEEYYDKKNKN